MPSRMTVILDFKSLSSNRTQVSRMRSGNSNHLPSAAIWKGRIVPVFVQAKPSHQISNYFWLVNKIITYNLRYKDARVSAEKFSGGGGGATEKRPKNSKKDRKIALLSLFQGEGGNGKNDRKIAKKDRKIALLSLYLLYVPCMKIDTWYGFSTAWPAMALLPTPMYRCRKFAPFTTNTCIVNKNI